MSLYLIPLPQTNGQDFNLSVELSGVVYRFDFFHNKRDPDMPWSFALSDAGGDPICAGLPCKLDYDLLAFVSDEQERTPDGLLFFTDTSGNGTPAGANELGARVKLLYDDLL